MNEEIKIETPLVMPCFDRFRFLFSSVPRSLRFIHHFEFETEDNPIWQNNPDHYFETIDVILEDNKISELYHEDIDKLIEFTDKIKEIRKKYEYVIKDRNFYKKKKIIV